MMLWVTKCVVSHSLSVLRDAAEAASWRRHGEGVHVRSGQLRGGEALALSSVAQKIAVGGKGAVVHCKAVKSSTAFKED